MVFNVHSSIDVNFKNVKIDDADESEVGRKIVIVKVSRHLNARNIKIRKNKIGTVALNEQPKVSTQSDEIEFLVNNKGNESC